MDMHGLDAIVIVQLIFLCVGGLLIGSFLNVVISRVPLIAASNETPIGAHAPIFDLLTPARSMCPACATGIPWWRNIPVLSWLLLRGIAACCQAQIPIRYLVVELLGLLIAFIAWIVHGPTWSAVPFAAFCYGMLAIAVVDLETYTIPSILSVPMIAAGLLLSTLESETPITAVDAIYGAACGGIGLWLVRYVHRRITGRIGLGSGDILLTAALGAWLGYLDLLPAVSIAFVCAGTHALWLVYVRRQTYDNVAPLGPFLAVGGIGVILTRDLSYLPAIFAL